MSTCICRERERGRKRGERIREKVGGGQGISDAIPWCVAEFELLYLYASFHICVMYYIILSIVVTYIHEYR